MKKLWVLLACTAIASCGVGKVDVDERGVFRAFEYNTSEDWLKVQFERGAPNAKFVDREGFKIDLDVVEGGSKDLYEKLLDCRVVIRIDPGKQTRMKPDITDCKRIDG